MKKYKFLKYAMILSLLQTSYVPLEATAAGGGSCSQKIVAKCKSSGQAAGQTGFTGGSGMYGNASTGSAETLAAGARVGAAAKDCKASAKQCDQCPEAEREQCKKDVEGAAGNMEAQSAGMGDAGAAMGAIAGMMAGILPMLLQKKKEDEQNKANESALRPDGSIDCSKNDAYMFTQCDEQLSTACKNAMTDPRCVNFAGRYCPSTGSGTPYCNTVAAYNYCSPGGRDTCPSCLQLQKESSEACQLDPAQCLAQNSAAELQKARAQCPTDPIFAAMPASSATSPVVAVPGATPVAGGGVNNPNLPPVVLPKSLSTASVNGTATRDAYSNNPSGQVSSGASSASSSAGSGSGTAIRDTAAIRTASVGPAPDVVGPYGPSVFATSSQVIRSHCAAGKFLNCP